ncbi:hypothetical protein RF11_05735 [Thelohanellus kitauei]|uniref:Uncharacterized protein n=1 Tax=Thelohanellus kitauei TaxID=669202 RepID=A0A0C2ND85_THEKT|nr:hypothetical protein RF11_05735 [Thelohanellus kitauei]
MLDQRGHYLPNPKFNEYSLTMKMTEDRQFAYDVNNKVMYLYVLRWVWCYEEKNGSFTHDPHALYRLGFHVVSMAHDYSKSLLFLLDNYTRLFVISLQDNYIKLLTRDVTSFQFHMDIM